MSADTIRPTRFAELGYRQDGPKLWRFYDIMDKANPAAVGPQYPSKGEMLADLDRYAAEFGCEGSTPIVKLGFHVGDVVLYAGMLREVIDVSWDRLTFSGIGTVSVDAVRTALADGSSRHYREIKHPKADASMSDFAQGAKALKKR